MFALVNLRDSDVILGLSKEEVEEKVRELGLSQNEWRAELCM